MEIAGTGPEETGPAEETGKTAPDHSPPPDAARPPNGPPRVPPPPAYPPAPPPRGYPTPYSPPQPDYPPPDYPPPDYPPPGYPPPGYPPPGYPPLPSGYGRRIEPPRDGGDEDLPPRTRTDGWIWLSIALVGFLVGQVLSSIMLYIGAAATGNLSDVSQLAGEAVPPAWVVVCGLVGLWIGFAGAVVFASRTRGTGSVRRDMRIEVRPWDLIIGPVVGLAGQFVLVPLLYLPLEHVIPHLSKRLSQPAKHLTGGFPGADLVVIAVLTVVVVPVIEETLFRGLVLRGFLRVFDGAGRVLGPVLACGATGIVFGLAHFELLELLGLAAFGVVLSVLAYKMRRIGPCIFAHAAFNLVAILVIAFPAVFAH